jgi:hypothetical protein
MVYNMFVQYRRLNMAGNDKTVYKFNPQPGQPDTWTPVEVPESDGYEVEQVLRQSETKVMDAVQVHESIQSAVGLKFDDGKERYDLLPPDAIRAIVRVLTYGSVKYAPRNWEKGIAYSRLIAASRRHEAAWEMGEDFDPETGIHHLAHKACCDIMMLAQELRGMTNFDDIPSRAAAVENKDIAVVISTEGGE